MHLGYSVAIAVAFFMASGFIKHLSGTAEDLKPSDFNGGIPAALAAIVVLVERFGTSHGHLSQTVVGGFGFMFLALFICIYLTKKQAQMDEANIRGASFWGCWGASNGLGLLCLFITVAAKQVSSVAVS